MKKYFYKSMIKPIQLADSIIELGQKAVKGNETAESITEQVTSQTAKAGSELLQAYHGVNAKKLFENFSDFVADFKTKLATFKGFVPDELIAKLEKQVDANDFSLQKTVSEHYSGLNQCKTLEDVRKLYPEINPPKLNFEEEIETKIKNIVSKEICDGVAKLKTREEKQALLDEYFKKNISKQVESWEIYPEFKAIQNKVADEIIDGKYVSTNSQTGTYSAFNQKMPLRYRFIHTEDREKAFIEMLKEHFINGKGYTEIAIKTTDGKEINAQRLKYNFKFGELDKHFRGLIKSSEHNAQQFQNLGNLDRHEISSAIMTKSWRTSKLRVDLGNETAYKKDWSLVKAVWQKTMFPETTYYPTEKLIDAYLVNLFKNGKTTGINPNPFAKHLETPYMDKTKIMLLKRLYKSSKDLDMDKNLLKTERFQQFKSQFNIEEMKKTIESLEEHYKNAFFKRFWTDERKNRFANALRENSELASQNIEISDKILLDAMDNLFTEI